jgi:hypothetical protein
MPNTIVRARIDGQVKEEAAAVLASIGLTVSDAFRLMMIRIAKGADRQSGADCAGDRRRRLSGAPVLLLRRPELV